MNISAGTLYFFWKTECFSIKAVGPQAARKPEAKAGASPKKGEPKDEKKSPASKAGDKVTPTPHTPYTPFTLHPTPYNLHPTPCSLHQTPYTSHPAPFTRHPTSHTPHHTPARFLVIPTPQTLNPFPFPLFLVQTLRPKP